ncbi:MAG: prepilin peptidase [Janthinobacterium lividum]
MPSWVLVLLVAPVIGSFAGVLIRRLPEQRPVAVARSACEACGHELGPRELVPVLSFVVQRGRCRACGEAIPPFHLWVELAAVAVAGSAVLAAWVRGGAAPGWDGGALWATCGLGWALMALAWIDARHFLLPDVLTLPLLLGGLAACEALEPWALQERLVGAVAGYCGLRGVALAYRALRGREGMGAGDAKLLAACGAWLGWAALPDVLLFAALAGLAAAGAMRLRGVAVGRATAVPFGPALAAGCWAVRLWGG